MQDNKINRDRRQRQALRRSVRENDRMITEGYRLMPVARTLGAS